MPEMVKGENAANELQLVIFRLGGEEFGLEVGQVKEIIRMQNITPMPKAPDFIEGVINLRGQIVAVMDLANKFGLGVREKTEKSRIVVVEVDENIVGMIVDEVPEVLRISEDRVEPAPDMIESQVKNEFITGVGKFEDRLIIILDANKILDQEEIKQLNIEESK